MNLQRSKYGYSDTNVGAECMKRDFSLSHNEQSVLWHQIMNLLCF